jgi:hypothetical protein
MPDPTRPLSEAELAAQQAVDLPDREALSLFDAGRLLGGTTVPTTPTDSPAAADSPPPAETPPAETTPTDSAPPPTDPMATAPEDPTGLAGRFSGIQDKFVG